MLIAFFVWHLKMYFREKKKRDLTKNMKIQIFILELTFLFTLKFKEQWTKWITN